MFEVMQMEGLVCEVLNTFSSFNGSLHDDTLLEKFEGILNEKWLSSEPDSKLLNPILLNCFKNYLTKVSHGVPATEQIVLGLKLGSRLLVALSHHDNDEARHEELQVSEMIFSLFEVCLTEDNWCEASVRHAWIQSTGLLLSHEASSIKITSMNGYARKIISCLDDSSMFVSKIAQTTLAKFLLILIARSDFSIPIDDPSRHDGNSSSALCVEILHTLLQFFNFSGQMPLTAESAIYVFFLLKPCNDTDPTDLLKIKNVFIYLVKNGIQQHLIDIMCSQERSAKFDHILGIFSILKSFQILGNEHMQSLAKCSLVLLEKNLFRPAVHLAHSLISSGLCNQSQVTELMQIISLPVVLYTGEQQNVSQTVNVKSLQSHSMVLLSLNTMQKLPEDDLLNLKNVQLVKKVLKKLSETGRGAYAIHDQLKHTGLLFLARLIQSSQCPHDKAEILTMFQLCVLFTKGPTSMVADVAYKCMMGLLRSPCEERPITAMLETMLDCLQQSLSELRWEMRDTGIQAVTSLAHLAKESEAVCFWLRQNNLANIMMQCTCDSEAYVRASALQAASLLITLPSFHHMTTAVYGKAADLAQCDTEAITRRVAVNVLCSITESTTDREVQLHQQQFISNLVNDLDWQVKLSVLNHCDETFQQLMANGYIPSYAQHLYPTDETNTNLQSNLQKFCDYGCATAVMTSLQDCDPSVQYKACCVLQNCQNICKTHGLINVLNAPNAATSNDQILNETETKHNGKFQKAKEFLEKVKHFQQPREDLLVDSYENNPLLLLQDLLTAMGPHDEDSQQIVDCY